MNEIHVQQNKDLGLVVSSRVVANELEREHKNVKRDLEQILIGSDLSALIIPSEYKDSRGRTQKEYLLTKDGFTLYMFNIQGHNDFKMAYINKFNEMEQQLSQPVASYMIDDPIKRAEKWIEEYREKEQLIEENRSHLRLIESQKPKVLFAETLAGSEKSILISELAKLISQNGYKIGPNKLFEWLRKNGYLTKRKGESWNLPTQKGMNLGVFEIKKGVRQHADGSPQVTRTTKVTPKGQEYFINKFLGQQHQLSFGGQL